MTNVRARKRADNQYISVRGMDIELLKRAGATKYLRTNICFQYAHNVELESRLKAARRKFHVLKVSSRTNSTPYALDCGSSNPWSRRPRSMPQVAGHSHLIWNAGSSKHRGKCCDSYWVPGGGVHNLTLLTPALCLEAHLTMSAGMIQLRTM